MLSDLRECVVGDTRLTDACTGKQVPIRNVKSGDRIIGMDARQKLGAFTVCDVWSTGSKPVFTLTTRTGRKVAASANHPFFTARGWKRLEELKVGDVIAGALRLPNHGDELPERALLCRLLGYLTGDGTFQTHRSIGFCGSDITHIADVQAIVAAHFPEVKWHEKRNTGRYWEGELTRIFENGYGKPGGNPLREWLREIGIYGERDNTKFVPDYVFEAGKSGAREFLAGYFASDGCVKTRGNRWEVQFDTVSRRLAEDVQCLLLRLGVVSVINKEAWCTKSTCPLYRISVLAFAENLRQLLSRSDH